jgi:ribosomal protein L11 methylase PrmA
VVDLGCGRGTWLKAFKEIGATKLVGFDDEWNMQENMIDRPINFKPCELNKRISVDPNDRFELAISLEVGEHLATRDFCSARACAAKA